VEDNLKKRIAVVIPCYRSKLQILGVLSGIGDEVWRVYVIDDACPEGSGKYVEEQGKDLRIRVIFHEFNKGVGGAVITGYRAAIADGADVIVKIDSDGQMDPKFIPIMVAPILDQEADYTKGNRFFDLENIRSMPTTRIFGNAILSLMAKLSTGYWDIFDPTNGYTAIHAGIAELLPFSKISQRYFFESDLLFRLNTLYAVVVDVPMDAKYGDEVSNLKITRIVGEFLIKHFRNFMKRIFYNYYLRDLSIASIELPLGSLFLISGISFGLFSWLESVDKGIATVVGSVMLPSLLVLMGLQFILGFLAYDIATVPRRPRQKIIGLLGYRKSKNDI
jgi:glycosyltransferase involved in cell wall biosynthesis